MSYALCWQLTTSSPPHTNRWTGKGKNLCRPMHCCLPSCMHSCLIDIFMCCQNGITHTTYLSAPFASKKRHAVPRMQCEENTYIYGSLFQVFFTSAFLLLQNHVFFQAQRRALEHWMLEPGNSNIYIYVCVCVCLIVPLHLYIICSSLFRCNLGNAVLICSGRMGRPLDSKRNADSRDSNPGFFNKSSSHV